MLDRQRYLDHLDADIDAFAAAVEAGPLDAPVPWCGTWRLADLTVHLGGVHRWATSAVVLGSPPRQAPDDPAPADARALAGWLRAGGQRLLAVLRELDLDGPTWHPFPVEKVGAVWPRRQAQEASVHRWDAQRAIGLAPTIDPLLAADGIDEYFAVALPRLIRREGVVAPTEPLLVRTIDTGDGWLVAGDGVTVVAVDDVQPHGELAGAAQDELLRLWRRPVPDDALTVTGAARGWLELGGM